MRFYLLVAFIVLGILNIFGSAIIAVVPILLAIALTLLVNPTSAEMKSGADSTMRLTTIVGGVALLLFGHWILAILATVFYFTYTDRFNFMVKEMKRKNNMETPVENEVQ